PGAVFANVLADLEFTQAPDHRRANDQADKQCGEAGERSAEGQIAKDSERADVKDEKTFLVEQPIEQILPRSKSYTGSAILVCSLRRFTDPGFQRALQAHAARRPQQDVARSEEH